jgi:hypothetical protein
MLQVLITHACSAHKIACNVAVLKLAQSMFNISLSLI